LQRKEKLFVKRNIKKNLTPTIISLFLKSNIENENKTYSWSVVVIGQVNVKPKKFACVSSIVGVLPKSDSKIQFKLVLLQIGDLHIPTIVLKYYKIANTYETFVVKIVFE